MNLRQRRRHVYQRRGFGWGKRCPDYFSGCIQCGVWRFYDTHKRWPTSEEVQAIEDNIHTQEFA